MRIHPNTKIIYGPPGTGKTTELIRQVSGLLEDTKPERIMFTSYTRTGAYVARDRALEQFSYDKKHFRWFSTLHSICFRLLGMPKLMSNNDKLDFGKSIGTSFTFTHTTEDDLTISITKGDKMQHIHEMSIKTGEDIESVRVMHAREISKEAAQHFTTAYTDYKKANDVIDFTDMLYLFMDLGVADMPDIDYLIVDEAQDLFPLQWKVIEKLAAKAKELIIAGDDDQCIHAWSGSTPEFLLNLEAEKKVLPQSYRIPKKVHTLAETIINKVSKRESKQYNPTEHEGELIHFDYLDNIPFDVHAEGSWLFLTRNRTFIERYSAACYKKCIVYTSVCGSTDSSFQTAIVTWKKLMDGNSITGKDAKQLYHMLKTRDRVKHSYKKVLEEALEDEEMVRNEDLVDQFGLLYQGRWQGAFFDRSQFEIDYYTRVDEGYGFADKPLVRLSTIHSAKGDEADNVVIIPDMTPRTARGYREDPDNEHRVFYVGVTRAKQRLYIGSPMAANYYEF